MNFYKVKVVCPRCKVEKNMEIGCVEKGCDLTAMTCSDCGHNWRERVSKMQPATFAKSALSGNAEIEQMRAQMAAQFEQLTSLVAKVGKILEERNRASSTFQPLNGEPTAVVAKAVIGMPGGIVFMPQDSGAETVVQKNFSPADSESRANSELEKALANPMPVTIPSGDGTGQPFKVVERGGLEKVEQAHEELQKALRQGTRVGFVPRG
jgi:hypothetical protein